MSSELSEFTTTEFILKNSLLKNAVCSDGSYGLLWQGPCKFQNTACESSALDLLTSSGSYASNQPDDWLPIGLGNCVDNNMQPMPNCYKEDISEELCRTTAKNDKKAVAYDISTSCNGKTFCRVRTLGEPSNCLPGWSWGGGSATTVTSTNRNDLTLCVIKNKIINKGKSSTL